MFEIVNEEVRKVNKFRHLDSILESDGKINVETEKGINERMKLIGMLSPSIREWATL